MRSQTAIFSSRSLKSSSLVNQIFTRPFSLVVQKAARDLIVQQHSLDMFGFEYIEYYQIIRELIEDYRLLFIDWVAGFDKWDYIIDRWGLFNPPGVGPYDKDPDDDIPFHGFEEDPEA